MTDTLRVVYKRPGEKAQVREISNSLDALQHLVLGYIELAKVVKKGIGVLCNEEALLRNFRYNCLGLAGPIVWLGLSEDDFRSLTDEEVAEIMEVYG